MGWILHRPQHQRRLKIKGAEFRKSSLHTVRFEKTAFTVSALENLALIYLLKWGSDPRDGQQS